VELNLRDCPGLVDPHREGRHTSFAYLQKRKGLPALLAHLAAQGGGEPAAGVNS
jgi:hypothetical protein